jgi:UDP-GlcNAc:undecaprenyl-phosphate GlcNAc-1-phosphate transferase
MTAPLMVLAVPLIDTALAIVRRYLRGQPIFAADRGHIHHRLLARGFTPRRVVLLLYASCGLCASLALLQSLFNERFGGAIIISFCAIVWFGVQHLQYAEFDAARRIVFGGKLRHLLHGELQLVALRDALAEAATPDQYWKILQRSYRDFGFSDIRFRFQGRTYSDSASGNVLQPSWSIRIALSETDYMNLSREFGAEVPAVITAFADTIGGILRSRTGVLADPVHAPAPAGVFQLAAESRIPSGANYQAAKAG